MRTSKSRPYLAAVVLVILVGGCSTAFNPKLIDEVPFRKRAVTQEEGGVRVTAAVPTAKETHELFGARLYRKGIQPVWVEVENRTDSQVSFLSVGLDPDYFTPFETAFFNLGRNPFDVNPAMSQHYDSSAMDMLVGPGETVSGFVFTTVDEGTKDFNVDVVGDEDIFQFTFFIPVPGLRIDHHKIDWENLYPPGEVRDFPTGDLIKALNAEPCCTTDKKSKGQGDPLNLVVIGDLHDVYHAFLRAGWDETESIYRGSLWKTITSFFSGGEYRYSPVSGLYVFGRPQDVAFQKARDNIHERNHLRLWASRERYGGKPVWLGQISRDIGVRFTMKTITTHKIDPDVDETREFLLEDLAYSQGVAKFAYVGGVGAAPFDEPRRNLTGDPYFTDGYRIVLWVAADPVAIDDIEVLNWEQPPQF